MTDTTDTKPTVDIKEGVSAILSLIDQEREREIITRRFGLYDRRETLEQIGELLGITRERVRQLEKAILIRLKIAAEEGKTDTVAKLEKVFIRTLSEMGRAARIADLADQLYGRTTDAKERAHVAFIATLVPHLTVIDENDNYHQSVAMADYGDEKALRARIDEIVTLIKTAKEPQTVTQLYDKLNYENPQQVAAAGWKVQYRLDAYLFLDQGANCPGTHAHSCHRTVGDIDDICACFCQQAGACYQFIGGQSPGWIHLNCYHELLARQFLGQLGGHEGRLRFFHFDDCLGQSILVILDIR